MNRRTLLLQTSTLAGTLLAGKPAGAQFGAPPANTEGVSQALIRQAGLEGRVLWMDGTANLERLSTPAGVGSIFDRCVRANINTVVVDVKPLSGHVLYASRVAPRLREWRGFQYPAGYDLLATALAEGHRRGLKVYANVNVFSDGHKLVNSGPGFPKRDLQAVICDVERAVTTPRGDRRVTALGSNRTPTGDQVCVYDHNFGSLRTFLPGEAFVLVLSDRVEAVVEGSLGPAAGVRIPREGYLLVGRGEGARWLLDKVRVGDTLSWTSADRLIPIADAPSETVALFLNPSHPQVQQYALSIIDEIVSRYEVDGVVFDRMRYPSLQGDFSELSRRQFEEHLGQPLNRYPADIYSFDPVPSRPLVQGPFYKQWLEWRAQNIRRWLEQASALVRAKRPEARLGVYVGSWYSSYYTVGVNWGAEDFLPRYDWQTLTYNRTGYAGLLDWVSTGCYYPIATRVQARSAGLDETYSVQAAAEMSARAVGDMAFTYAGIYVQDYKGAPEAFSEAVRAAKDSSHGVMIFDLSQLDDYGYWGLLEEEFRQQRPAPHDVPELLAGIRAMRRALNLAR